MRKHFGLLVIEIFAIKLWFLDIAQALNLSKIVNAVSCVGLLWLNEILGILRIQATSLTFSAHIPSNKFT